jgi:hypothetical protein
MKKLVVLLIVVLASMQIFAADWQHVTLKAAPSRATSLELSAQIKLDYQVNTYSYHNRSATQVSPLWVNVERSDLSKNDKVRIVFMNFPYYASSPTEQQVTIKDLSFAENGRFSTELSEVKYQNFFNARQEIAVVINGIWLSLDEEGVNTNFEFRLVPFVNP